MKTPSLSSDIVQQIRTARSAWVPWPDIAKHLGRSVDDCRAAIGLPSLKPIPEPDNQPDLFAGVGFLGDDQNGGES